MKTGKIIVPLEIKISLWLAIKLRIAGVYKCFNCSKNHKNNIKVYECEKSKRS